MCFFGHLMLRQAKIIEKDHTLTTFEYSRISKHPRGAYMAPLNQIGLTPYSQN